LDVVDVGVGAFACKVPSHHLHCEDYNELLWLSHWCHQFLKMGVYNSVGWL
jgi:hypothetical protein